MRRVAWLVVLAGCDRLLGLGAINPVNGDAMGGGGSDAVHDVTTGGSDAVLDALSCTVTPADPKCHDEDGDGVVDADDDCPTVANAPAPGSKQGDLDGDGVGDACDPHSQAIGDSIVNFAPFAAGFDGGWTADAAGWTAASDKVTSPTGTTTSSNLTHAALQAKHPTIEVIFEFKQLTVSTGSTFGPRLDFLPTFPASCRSESNNTIALDDTNTPITNTPGPQYAINQLYVARFQRGDPTNTCDMGPFTISQNDQDVTDIVVTPKVVVDKLQVEIHSIVIYASP